MDNKNNKSRRTISDALINTTEDFLLNEEDDLEEDDNLSSKKDQNDKQLLSIDQYEKELVESTDRVLITEELTDDDLVNVPSEVIKADKTSSKSAMDYLNIDHVTDLFSANTGTFNTISVHDASFIQREGEDVIRSVDKNNLNPQSRINGWTSQNQINPINKRVLNNLNQHSQFSNKIDVKSNNNQFNSQQNQNNESNLNRSIITKPAFPRSESLFSESKFNKDDDIIISKEQKNISSIDSLVNKEKNIFESSSIIESIDHSDFKYGIPNYRDDKFERTSSIDLDLQKDEEISSNKNQIAIKQSEDLMNKTTKLVINLEDDEDIIPKKMTIDMQNIESDINEIAQGNKSNLYQYIRKNNHQNISTDMLFPEDDETTNSYNELTETNKSVEKNNESRQMTQSSDDRKSLFKKLDKEIQEDKKNKYIESNNRSSNTNYKEVNKQSVYNSYDKKHKSSKARVRVLWTIVGAFIILIISIVIALIATNKFA
ncbi:hypothetical protein [Mycoplasma bradburyae]|uniref:hypothetical protein n=1 Tax=Mycoplasma bradburyae TaxID=2963128 RepID=UPI0023405E2B|nr:hypothetical protein [Mycoplasma bradburyae]MDC4184258.1 hypothetical protein [Mycoplasma bradburyae]